MELPTQFIHLEKQSWVFESSRSCFRVYPLIHCVNGFLPWVHSGTTEESFTLTLMPGTHPMRCWCSRSRLEPGISFEALQGFCSQPGASAHRSSGTALFLCMGGKAIPKCVGPCSSSFYHLQFPTSKCLPRQTVSSSRGKCPVTSV